MPTLTIDLPETAYRAALSFPTHERARLAAIMFMTAEAVLDMEDDPTLPDYDRETNEDDLEAIGRGLADIEAGRTIPGDVFFARLQEQFKVKP